VRFFSIRRPTDPLQLQYNNNNKRQQWCKGSKS
jgi:hypothetical protein